MKCLRIESNKGQFSVDGENWRDIETIGKDELLTIIDLVLDESCEIEMDIYDEEKIKNPGHKIIYRNIFEKLNLLKSQKTSFLDEKNSLYKDAVNKYEKELDLLQSKD